MTHGVHLQGYGVKQTMKVHLVGNNSTPKKMVIDVTRRGTLEKVTHRVIPLSGKRITFDIEIIEILYTSLRQITIDRLTESERMTFSI